MDTLTQAERRLKFVTILAQALQDLLDKAVYTQCPWMLPPDDYRHARTMLSDIVQNMCWEASSEDRELVESAETETRSQKRRELGTYVGATA